MAELVNSENGELIGSQLMGKLLEIQGALKCDKSQYNSFGGFAYRSKEDILESLKPLAHERGCVVLVDDGLEEMRNGWVYVVSTARLVECATGEAVAAKSACREPESKKGMDASQITGCAASYAGKRALGNLFAIDDTKDSDDGCLNAVPQEKQPPAGQSFVARCQTCGAAYTFMAGTTIEQVKATACCARPDWRVQ